jgi:hypothetical protein
MSKNRPARTREEWLREAIRRFRPVFKEAGIEIPKGVRITIGFGPTGARQENATILGVTAARVLSSTNVNEIFISPEHAEAPTMLATVIHELIHAVDDCEHGHKGPFVEMAKALGLDGKMTATVPGEELTKALEIMADEMGPYPGSKMNLEGGRPIAGPGGEIPGGPITSGPRRQGTRMIKRMCVQDPEQDCFGYAVRLTQKWIDVGNPHCPNGHEMTV